MKVIATGLEGVLLLEPRVFGDERGFVFESFNEETFRQATGVDARFVQDNHSQSGKKVLRGLHYQVPPMAQGKLVRVARGEVYDVAVDVRRDSPTLGRWVARVLSEQNRLQLWIPPGFAHGFLVLSDTADVLYKATQFYSPLHERSLAWDDAQLGIDWPLRDPILSLRDRQALYMPFAELS